MNVQCSGLNSGSQKNMFMPQSLGHADVTVFGKGAFVDIIKDREVILDDLGWP